ncbi:ATP-binding protein [Rhizobium tumorigenes]|uniref:ATP-binding protein n=1 Tax=Rhizobium tumorigenes TaxID=2041385 RepID=UPI00241C3321|nr:ATP-binding protein [Rhizobium tumorigenes]WFR99579.1 ATP-binding protein [Rhizobium tumorigenes]
MTLGAVLRTADATPQAAALIEGLRDMGYSLESALADIIDNSVTAGARRVEILAETGGYEPSIAILDDGIGMTEVELIAAMRPGSRNPLETRKTPDLGRFGLGLKSASFSQCRVLTVITKVGDVVSAAVWDLDKVATTNRWEIDVIDNAGELPLAHKIGESGTLVLWQKLDRISGESNADQGKRAEVINHRIATSEHHLRLVFHRFMEASRKPITILLNGRPLKPIDPFARDHPATIMDPEEVLPLRNGNVTIQSTTLPHHKTMSQAAWDELGGPEGHLKSQGFYLYRGNRLIIHGTWFGLCRQSELNKLCRVRIDIPNSMDASWKIDVKKSSAQLPPLVRDRLKKVLERISDGSRRTFRKRGQKLVDQNRMPMWHRVMIDETIRYRPNADHPAFTAFADSLPQDLRGGFYNCISLVGASLPIDSLHADMAGNAEQVAADAIDDDTLSQAVEATLVRLLDRNFDLETITAMLKDVDPFRSSWETTRLAIQRFTETGTCR